MTSAASPLDLFRSQLSGSDLPDRLRAGIIGKGVAIPGPYGDKALVYADYVASGRALIQVEDFVRDHVLPYYANSHTEASFCGAYSTRLRNAARQEIARIVGAPEGYSVVFTGSGATAGLNCLVGVLGIADLIAEGKEVVVFVGPYEHHSNLLPWRESGAEVIEVPEAQGGGPDLAFLEAALRDKADAALRVGTFSSVSNVTGICTDTDVVTEMLRRHDALALWDFAGGAPYVAMQIRAGTAMQKDAIALSPHKFPGGPGASGLLILRDAIARRRTPTRPGGGTVSFVSPWEHRYSDNLSNREEAGTPNVVGDIRAALALMVKEALGQTWLDEHHAVLRTRALKAWRDLPELELLGKVDAPALPIFSFRVFQKDGALLHHQLFTRMLSDVYGIQARGGCACAGSYAHRLLGIDQAHSAALLEQLLAGEETEKPGWVRLNLSALHSEAEINFILDAVKTLAQTAQEYLGDYTVDPRTARFRPTPERVALRA